MGSKNNPRNRDKQRLIVKCPVCENEMRLVKLIPGGMRYKCEKCGDYHPVTKGCYVRFPHEWVKAK